MSVIEVRNPADGLVVGSIPCESAEEVRSRAALLRSGQKNWAAAGPTERARWLRRLQEWLLDNSEHIADVIQSETGKPRTEAAFEVPMAVSIIDYFARNAEAFLRPERVKPHNPLGYLKSITTEYRAIPLVGVITPWNFPMLMPIYDVVPALVAGSAVLLKPSEVTPLGGLELARGWAEIGAPTVFGVASGDRSTGRAVVDLADFVQFTGSTRAGREIAQACASRLIPCSLELGGKDPAIVLDDADLERAARGVTYGALLNAGQVCVSVERVYVQDSVHDRFVALLSDHVRGLRQGQDGKVSEHDIGALANESQLELVRRQVNEAVESGANVVVGGRPTATGAFFEPTVLTDVDHGMLCIREETFGPLIPVVRVRDEDEAIRLANDSKYGLSATVWSRDHARAGRVARQLEAGAVNINDVGANFFAMSAPMGGWKDSGIGSRWGGAHGVRKYCREQVVTTPRVRPGRREFIWYPYTPRKLKISSAVMTWLSTRRGRSRGCAPPETRGGL